MKPEKNEGHKWTVEFYVDRRGRSPVGEFIAEIPDRQQAPVVRYLKLLQEFGPTLTMPQARHIEGKLWELRPFAYRVFYFCLAGQRCVLLHAYRKSQKTPRKEIDRALARMRDFVSRE